MVHSEKCPTWSYAFVRVEAPSACDQREINRIALNGTSRQKTFNQARRITPPDRTTRAANAKFAISHRYNAILQKFAL